MVATAAVMLLVILVPTVRLVAMIWGAVLVVLRR